MNDTFEIKDTDLTNPQLESSDLNSLLGKSITQIDGKLTELTARNLVSANEMSDMLLDLRLLLTEAQELNRQDDVAPVAH